MVKAAPGDSYSGDMVFITRPAASVASEKMRIDKDGNVGIGTNAPGEKLDVRGTNYRLSNYHVTKEFGITFPNSVANQKVDFYMTGTQQFWGTIEVTVVDTYSYQNAAGRLVKVYGLGLNPGGTIYSNDARYTEVMGATADNWALSDLSWDATNSRYKITLVHRVSTGNTPRVSIRAIGQATSQTDNAATFTAGSVYTTDTTVYSRPYEHFNNNVGIGTTSPAQLLHVSKSGSAAQVYIGNRADTIADDTASGVLNFVAGSSNTVIGRVSGNTDGTAEAGGHVIFETRVDGGSLTEKMRIEGNGNVGIGTNVPETILHVKGSNQPQVNISSTNSDTALRIHTISGGQARLEFFEVGSTGWSIGERGA
ncbi:MAG: hypothetical protein QF535_02250, partial [Anaerolineales bacterium]|nr:hypothetical protein [Anaerolineales bacterium]